MKTHLLTLMLIIISLVTFGQYEKQVLLYTIGDNYEGDTRRGLAHGEGKAFGIDRYIGEFKKGLPDGNGTYYWHSGEVYEGNWRKGEKEGYGKLSFKINETDSVLEGFWFEDRFFGDKKNPDPDYKIITDINIARNNVQLLNKSNNQILVKFETVGRSPFDILFQESSGVYTLEGPNKIRFESVEFPFTLVLSYKINAPGLTSFFDCRYKIQFNKEGSWQVKLYN